MPDHEEGDAVRQAQGDSEMPPAPPIPITTQPLKTMASNEPTTTKTKTEGSAEPTTDGQGTKSRKAPSERWMIWLTAIIAFATGVNVLIFYLESESTGKQIDTLTGKAGGIVESMNTALSDNRNAIQKAFERNKSALEASTTQSKNSLDASIKAARTDQRSWLGVKYSALQEPLEVGKPIKISIQTFNTGKTPALDVVFVRASIGIDERAAEGVTTDSGHGVVPPNNPNEYYIETSPPDEATMQGLIAKKMRFYLRGQFTYRDIFKAPHKTTFCVYYPTSGATLALFNCKTGNSMN